MGKGKWTKGTRWANALKDFNSVYLNPFSSASTSAKITDGECTLSCGLRLQTSKALTNDSSADIYICLFPGAKGCLEYLSTEENSVTPKFMPYTDYELTHVQNWRIVSSGVRFLLTNNSDSNEGFFEAIRIPISIDNADFKDVVSNADPTVLQPAPNMTKLKDLNLVENPTYVCGRLRDIQKYEFQIKPQRGDHVFKGIKTTDTGLADNIPIGPYLDDNFDAVFIKISGRGGLTDQSQIMCHTCSNLELIYNDKSPFARFHSPGARDLSGLGRVQNILQSNMKAARRVIY